MDTQPLIRPVFAELLAAIRSLQVENQALQAQNKRLVEALREINEACGTANPSSFNQIKEAVQAGVEISEEALSTLPAETLEAERRREEVIRAAKMFIAKVCPPGYLENRVIDLEVYENS